MYHDQGLPVLKAASFGLGINVTLGLPFPRTSVDHGTALDLARDPALARTADAGSLIAATDLAIELANRAGPQLTGGAMHGHQARKRFGQNFLADPHYVARIVDAVDPQPGDNLVEIGPGLAALTGGLVERAGHITAIEIDRDLAARLRERVHARAAHAPRGRRARVRLRATRPRRCASSATCRTTSARRSCSSSPRIDAQLRDLHVMLQREVVARMTAAPGTADYGRLTVMLQVEVPRSRGCSSCRPARSGRRRRSSRPSRGWFRCVPDKPAIADEALFARIVAAAFSQRRKTLRNAVSALCTAATLEAAGIDPGARGETLAVADFVRLANRVAST